METQIFISPCKKYNLQKKSSKKKKPNSFKIYYNSIITNLKFQHKPKIYIIFQKSSYLKKLK